MNTLGKKPWLFAKLDLTPDLLRFVFLICRTSLKTIDYGQKSLIISKNPSLSTAFNAALIEMHAIPNKLNWFGLYYYKSK